MSRFRPDPGNRDLPLHPRLVVTDMDGTLLDPGGRLPQGFASLLAGLRHQGITFAIASGRQLPTLQAMISPADRAGVVFIAENGGHVVQDDYQFTRVRLESRTSRKMVATARAMEASRDCGLVWCAPEVAFVERQDQAFVKKAAEFFTSLQLVDDLLGLDEPAVKFTVFDPSLKAGAGVEAWEDASSPLRVVRSADEWLDIMDPTVNKGVAVRALQKRLGVGSQECIAFGDNLNDLEMFAEVSYSYAMANVHPLALKQAAFRAPSNDNDGVAVILRRLLDDLGCPAGERGRRANAERPRS